MFGIGHFVRKIERKVFGHSKAARLLNKHSESFFNPYRFYRHDVLPKSLRDKWRHGESSFNSGIYKALGKIGEAMAAGATSTSSAKSQSSNALALQSRTSGGGYGIDTSYRSLADLEGVS